VAAQSHKAIHNLLNEIEKFARETGLHFCGLKKSSADNPESVYESEFVKSEPQFNCIIEAGNRVQLLAGTAWLFSRHELDRSLDYLMIDEAGQVSLADALAMGTSARNLVLLGDPLQLAQCLKESIHRGVAHLFWSICLVTRRRFPRIAASSLREATGCTRMSALSFQRSFMLAGFHSDDSATRRTTSSGTGIRFVPVEHDGNRTPPTRRSWK
jgi:uncharacterized protein